MKKRNIAVGILIALAIPIAIVVSLTFADSVSNLFQARRALQNFSAALKDKDYERAYRQTAPELRAVTDYKSFAQMQSDLDIRMGALQRMDISEAEVKAESDAWYGTAEVNLVFARGRLPFAFRLKKEAEIWRVYSYREE